MRCSKCAADNREGRKFCAKCAAPLARPCPQCGASNEPGEDFCGECAAPLGKPSARSAKKLGDAPIPARASSPRENLEGERKTVTALFADIKGSTELEQDLDPEEARAIIDPALKIMIDAARRYDGYVQNTGDGIFALFGAPIAHEDHAQRALHAALRMQQEIRRYGDRLLQDGGAPIEIRIGVNTGEVVMRPLKTGDSNTEYAPIGLTTNFASRMQAVARTGSVVVSEATGKLVEGYFQLRSIGPTKVKGVTEPVQVYEVTGTGPLRTRLQRSAIRGYTKFVGREREMEALKHADELAKRGRGQIVAVVADPGVGKSRLFFEFKAKNQSGWMVLEALSISHGKASAYLPLTDLLHNYFEISAADDERKRREKVTGKVAVLDRSLEDTLPYLFNLLGLFEGDDALVQPTDVNIQKQRMVDAIRRILLRESVNHPLMLIFEDLHWMDGESGALLNLLADSMATSRILLLVNYRPEYRHQWGSKTYYTQLRLDPLGEESAEEMLNSLLGTEATLDPLKRLIADKTEGNPLFMEEIVLSLFEDGTLGCNGEVKLARPLASLRIPPTVQGILASRIDRLPADEKELLQTVAVIGAEFNLGLARAVSEKTDEDLNRMFSDLQIAEFIYEQPTTGDVQYTFKHALTRDVAYQSLLAERRKLLHQRTGQAIETLYADRLDDHLTELAHHFDTGGNVAKAVEYLSRSGSKTAKQGAHSQAIVQFTRALDLLRRLSDGAARDRQELDLQMALSWSSRVARGPRASEYEHALVRARELATALFADIKRGRVDDSDLRTGGEVFAYTDACSHRRPSAGPT